MILPLRKSLIILIALLQLVAPLVHAHSSGTQGAIRGIHLPGLEFVTGDKFKPGMHAQALHSDCYGITIGVSCGVHAKAQGDVAITLESHPFLAIYVADFIVAKVNFSPQQPSVLNPLTVLQPVSPRAPPFLPASA